MNNPDDKIPGIRSYNDKLAVLTRFYKLIHGRENKFSEEWGEWYEHEILNNK